ncbi:MULTISPECIES: hypothetical protein [unclassified Sporosarcina]|uniref:hypothetical protein n=1 Tax=unclassified Sporosarcina TaxID=2647733 RepID=UPI000C168867|nr:MULTISPECIES: hypothetical protein [unclassified Sporosarcina]PID04815.1 hypothetical protein CSV66_13180 [Sporosarcina sp. P30]PID07970.1 hypothetical protein CSV65_13380 [Sporosarcina sp. P31]PID11156.1 hypothetical protein CSV64_13410 [Sporosarcina sp. P32b]
MTRQGKDRDYKKDNRIQPRRKKQGIVIWSVVVIATVLFLLLVLPLLQESNTGTESIVPAVDLYEDLEGLQLNVLQEKALEDGKIEYLIEISNDTNRVIHQPTLTFSFDVKLKNGWAENPFKYSIDLGLQIEPGQKMKVPLAVDVSLLNQEKIDTDHIMLEMKGYLDELELENLFHTGQSISYTEGDRQWKKL